METIVCLKRTPDTTARVRPSADGKGIDPQGIEWIINPYDEIAVEQAVRIKEKSGGTVTAVTLDPDANPAIIRKAMAMGVDRGILIHGSAGMDAYAAAKALAGAISKQKFDLILCGKQGIDDDNYQVPSMLAHMLGLPRATVVVKLEVADGAVSVHRQIEGGEEVVRLTMPCLVSCQRGLNEPRFPSLKGIMDSKKKPLDVVKPDAIDATIDVLKIEPPPSRPAGRIVANVNGKSPDEIRSACRELVRLLKEEAKVL